MSVSQSSPARAVRTDAWAEVVALRSFRTGLGGVLALYAGLVLLWVLCVPLFGPADERAHVDYAWQLVHGHLPLAGPVFSPEFPELGQTAYAQHVSNHPPLFYLLAGPLVWLGDALGNPALGLYAVRLLNAALTAVTVLVVARTAVEVTAAARREVRAAVAVVAAAVVAVNPALLAASGAFQNDALAVLLAALVVLVLARAARTGVGPRTVALLALLCTLGTLTRVTFVTVVAVAAVALVALTLWPDLRARRPDRAAAVRAAGRGAAVVGAVVAGAGWFLLLNQRRYGDLTGGSAVYDLETVRSREWLPGAESGPLTYVLHPYTWWNQLLQLVAPVPSISRDRVPYLAMTAVLAVVLAAAAVAAHRRRGTGRVDRAGAVTLLVLGLLFAGALAKLAVHVSSRGGANQRYLLDAVGLWAVGFALLLVALGRWAPPAVAVVGGLGACGVATYAAGIVLRTDDVDGGSALGALRTSLATSIVPAAGLVCAVVLLLAVAGLAVVTTSVRRLLEEAS